ncbi:MAG TPA: hypothetical protein VFD43_04970, partial [Planctomycetota bacterium]|nr:hypothetical protein [Planctomycetota bacterium]
MLVLAACTASTARPPAGSELPADLQAGFDPPLSWADRFDVPVAGDDRHLSCALTFRNSGGEHVVRADWFASIDGVGLANATQELTTEFAPTAVCKRAGLTDTWYVAGWSDASLPIVEEWTAAAPAIGTADASGGAPGGAPGGASPRVLFTPPLVTRRRLFAGSEDAVPGSPGRSMVRAMGCNPWSGQLVLLFAGQSAQV